METILFNSTATSFIVVTIVSYYFLLQTFREGLNKTNRDSAQKTRIYNRAVITFAGWAIFISILALSGFLQNFSSFPPRILLTVFIPLVASLVFTFSSLAKEILPLISVQSLIRLQVFRVFVEILLWLLFIQQLLPVQMTFEGRNFDVISGLTAPVAAYLFSRNRTALVIWNLMSFGLLINIVSVAVLSMPTPFRMFVNEPSNSIVAQFPFVWLPGLLVPLAYGLHFLSLRQLSLLKKAGN